jgi:CDP-glucose 4,6-dehydratase
MLDAEVCGYALEPPSNPNMYNVIDYGKNFKDVREDIRNTELLRKTVQEFQPEIVFHLAAQPIVLESYNDPMDTFDINVIGTVNLLNELRKVNSVKTIVVVTSDKSYQNNEWVYPYRENDILGGKDPYSASKSCQDIVASSFRNSFLNDLGVGISAVRAGNVIGGGDWAEYRIIPDIVRGIMNDESIKIRNPDSVRPWQHVLEPISGMLLLAKKMWNNAKLSGAWNFGPENHGGITVKELTDAFIEYWGKGKYEIEKGSFQKEANYLNLDISKARKELNWSPRLDFNTCLKNTVDWYKAYYTSQDAENLTSTQIEDYSKTRRGMNGNH